MFKELFFFYLYFFLTCLFLCVPPSHFLFSVSFIITFLSLSSFLHAEKRPFSLLPLMSDKIFLSPFLLYLPSFSLLFYHNFSLLFFPFSFFIHPDSSFDFLLRNFINFFFCLPSVLTLSFHSRKPISTLFFSLFSTCSFPSVSFPYLPFFLPSIPLLHNLLLSLLPH